MVFCIACCFCAQSITLAACACSSYVDLAMLCSVYFVTHGIARHWLNQHKITSKLYMYGVYGLSALLSTNYLSLRLSDTLPMGHQKQQMT